VDSCDGVLIERCDINTGDDAISLKSGRGLAAQNLARPTQNVAIRDCRLHSSIYAALGFGTEMSGGIRNVKLENCIVSGKQNAIFIKSRDGRGGFMENISGENLTVLKSPTFIGFDLMNKGIQASDPVPGDVENGRACKTSASKKSMCRMWPNWSPEKMFLPRGRWTASRSPIFPAPAPGLVLANMTNVKLSSIRVTGFTGPLVTKENVTGAASTIPPRIESGGEPPGFTPRRRAVFAAR